MAPSSPYLQVPADRPAIVGREQERRLLRDQMDAAASGRGRLVIIGGEAGIGKTALCRDLMVAAGKSGVVVLAGHCYDLSATPPYGPWLDLAARYAPGDDLPPMPDVLADIRIDEIESQAALFAQVRSFLGDLASRRPVLVVLEDLHWADPASVDLLRHLGPRLAAFPILVVVTYRVDELTRRHPLYRQLPALVRESEGARLDLRRLDQNHLRALVAARWSVAPADEDRLVAYLDRHAEGNPFYALELLHALADEGFLRPHPDGDGWTLGELRGVVMPDLIRQVIDVRVGRLGEATREVLALAAVIGEEVPFDLWNAVAGLSEEDLLETVEQAVDGHLLDAARDGTRVRFVHALTREALYEGVLPPRRRIWHRQVAEALMSQATPDPDAVAYHLLQAGDPRAPEWLVRAGDRAQRAYAWLTAVERFSAAATLLADIAGQEWLRALLLYRCGRLRRYADPARGIAELVEADRLARAAGDPVLAADATYSLGLLRCFADDLGRGLAEMVEGIEALEGLPAALAGASWSTAAWLADAVPAIELGDQPAVEPATATLGAAGIHHRRGSYPWFLAAAGRYPEARANADRFLAGLGGVTAGPLVRSAVGHAHHGLGIVHAALDRPAEARREFAEARAWYRPLDHHAVIAFTLLTELRDVVLPYLTTDIAERHRVAAAAEEALDRARGALLSGVSPRWAWLSVWLLEGHWAEIRQIVDEASAHGNYVLRREITGALGLLACRQGNPDLAWIQIRGLLPHGPATEPGGAVFLDGLLLQRLAADLSLDRGDLSATRAWLEAHDRWLAWSGAVLGEAEGWSAWARYHRAGGDLDRARSAAAQAVRCAENPRRPLALLEALRVDGELAVEAGDAARAESSLCQALELAEACAAPYHRALTLLPLAALRAGTERSAEMMAHLTDARAILEPLGARPALDRLAALEDRIGRGAVPVAPAGLTQRELDVLRLVAEGLTDAAVAERLFISPRTVSQHLRSIYAKLGVSSRAAATRFAVEHGLT